MSKDIKPEDLKTELINDLIATTTVMEEIWNYHPDNPNKRDIVVDYKLFKEDIKNIESKLLKLS